MDEIFFYKNNSCEQVGFDETAFMRYAICMGKLQKGNQKSTGTPHNRTPPPLTTLEEFSTRLKSLQRERTNLLKEFRDLLTTQEMERTKKYLANHD